MNENEKEIHRLGVAQYKKLMAKKKEDLDASIVFYNKHIRFIVQNIRLNQGVGSSLISDMTTYQELEDYKLYLQEIGEDKYS